MDTEQPIAYLLAAISQVGFPIAVTSYLLIRFEKKLDILSATIARLSEAMKNQAGEE
ncbi:YvrJ family protein [Paenibacillus sambharensis]|uniref:YvrJ family protein n=1 Tax=Paenibacillus sambharensis TaxID=1803190 RepID=A0A2W1LPB5_9BACL|nr:YvrJ family protein [Paenibacillus sambharensis]PZD96705.1 YvrJ family protein [Paenibacillus sambharensis]